MKKFITLFLALALGAGMLTAAAAGGADPTLSFTVEAGEELAFSLEGISPALEPGRDLRGIVVTALPESGGLKNGGRPLCAGEGVLAESLGSLTYTGTGGEESFAFLAVYEDGAAGSSAGIRLAPAPTAPNVAPDARDMEFNTYKDTPRTLSFDASDENGDQLTFTIVSPPAKGQVSVEGGEFTYAPSPGKTGRDTFVYSAADGSGDASREALVTVNIARRAPKVDYADTAGTGVEYEAARLAEEGLFVGEQINGLYCFSPDSPVSRGDFLAMTVKAAGLEGLPAVTPGFADDASAPAWLCEYIAAARLAGAVQGEEAEGGRVFSPGRAITGREAGRVVASLMDMEASGAVETAAGDWAAVSAMALSEADFPEKNCFGPEALTRAEAARVIVSMLDYQ